MSSKDVEEEYSSVDEVGKEIDVKDDGGCIKTIAQIGAGWEKPEVGDTVTVHYTGTLEDGTKFDSSRDRDDPFTFVLGQGQVIKGWDSGVATMKKGERSTLKLRADYGYGEAGSPPKIPGGATLLFDVELLSWKSVRDLLGDGSVVKTVLSPGDGWANPSPRDEALVRVRAWVAGEGPGAKGPPTHEPYFSSAAAPGAEAEVAAAGAEGGEDEAPPSEEGALALPALGAEASPVGVGVLPTLLRGMKKGERVLLRIRSDRAFGDLGSAELGVAPGADVVADLQLVGWRRVEDVSEDGSVWKRTLVDPEGWKKPNAGAKVAVAVTATIERVAGAAEDEAAAPVVIFSRPASSPLRWAADDLEGSPVEVTEGLDLAVQKLKKGEVAEVHVAAPYAYGAEGAAFEPSSAPGEEARPPSTGKAISVPPGADLVYKVELLDFESAKDSWELSDAEKVAAAEATKALGTRAFKAGRLRRAVRIWRRAEDLVKYDDGFPDAEKRAAKALKHAVSLNLAAAELKLGDPKAAAAAADAALAHDPDDAKALYRRASAAIELDDFAEAELYIKRGLGGADRSKATIQDFHALKRRWRAASAESAKKESKIYGAMFKA